MKTSHHIELDFASIALFETYAISTIKEGVSLKQNQLKQFFEIFSEYYHEKPFISIANRKFDYSIDPNLLKTNKHPGILGIGVVCYNKHSRETATFEKTFYKGPFEIFDTIEDAIVWANELLTQYQKKAGL